jgi:uncharacterized protein (DUF302 family)
MPTDESTGKRREFVALAGLAFGSGLFSSPAAADGRETGTANDGGADECPLDSPGLVTTESDQSFEATAQCIETRIEDGPLRLMTTVDHAANAESIDEDLPPTKLFIFGNPAVGTPLMAESRSVGIDLPQKMLVWEDGDGVKITYNDPQFLFDRHEIEGMEDSLAQISGALQDLATACVDEG